MDEDGKLVVEDVYHGFDQTVLQQIRDYLNPPQTIMEPVKQTTPSLENWQKYMENISAVLRLMKNKTTTWRTADGIICP